MKIQKKEVEVEKGAIRLLNMSNEKEAKSMPSCVCDSVFKEFNDKISLLGQNGVNASQFVLCVAVVHAFYFG